MENVEGEPSAATKVISHPAQTCEPICFRDVVQKRAERRDDEREPFGELEGPHVGGDDGDALPHGLGSSCQLRGERVEHRTIEIERVNRNPGIGNRKRHAAGAGAQLQHGPARRLGLTTIPVDVALKRPWRHRVVEIRSIRHTARETGEGAATRVHHRMYGVMLPAMVRTSASVSGSRRNAAHSGLGYVAGLVAVSEPYNTRSTPI